MAELKTNVLYYGDNLDILRNRDYFPDASVDLIYLDPPFNSKANYNILFKEASGEPSQAQIRAFSDFWHWDQAAEETYRDIRLNAPLNVGKLIEAMVEGIGRNDVTAYLVNMTVRLTEMYRVLKKTGFLCFHCDPTASHYVKLVLDQVFGPKNFRNEIVWTYQKWGRKLTSKFQYQHQIILFYGGTAQASIKSYPTRPWESKEEYIRVRKQKVRVDQDGREYVLSDAGGGKRVKRYLDEAMEYGVPVGDVWDDIPGLTSSAKERLGYETQKPVPLLERIIQASSNEGDVVLDPFCGCGTTVVAAHKLNRRWIGIDITHLAIAVMKKRLQDSFPGLEFEVIGEPVDLESARALAAQDRYQFQWWALSLIGAMPVGDDRKKGADKGIDGVITFMDAPGGKTGRAIVQVKSGLVASAQIRDLKGVMEREKAALGLFVTLEPPTRDMRTEAVAAGFHQSELWQRDFPRVQILTVEELLAGKRPEVPGPMSPYAQAQRIGRKEGKQLGLGD